MESFVDYLIQNPIITVIGAAIIFVLTFLFVIKRIFTFLITFVILAICIYAAYVVIHPDSAIEHMKAITGKESDVKEEEGKSVTDQLQETYESGREKLMEYFDGSKKPAKEDEEAEEEEKERTERE